MKRVDCDYEYDHEREECPGCWSMSVSTRAGELS